MPEIQGLQLSVDKLTGGLSGLQQTKMLGCRYPFKDNEMH